MAPISRLAPVVAQVLDCRQPCMQLLTIRCSGASNQRRRCQQRHHMPPAGRLCTASLACTFSNSSHSNYNSSGSSGCRAQQCSHRWVWRLLGLWLLALHGLLEVAVLPVATLLLVAMLMWADLLAGGQQQEQHL